MISEKMGKLYIAKEWKDYFIHAKDKPLR